MAGSLERCWTAVAAGMPSAVLELRVRHPVAPTQDEVLARVSACGLNFLDVLACRGDYPNQPPYPLPLGVEFAGEVVEAGDATAFAVGDRVLGIAPLPLGALGSSLTVPARLVHRIPPDIAPGVAAAVPVNYQTAHVALHRLGRLRSGETVLVHAGAGGVGTATIQLAVAAGASVIALASTADKRERCRNEGATVTLDPSSATVATDVLEATQGRGVDLVIDSVGGPSFDASLDAIAFEGRVVVVGFSSGTVAAPLLTRLLARNASVIGLSWGEHYPRRDPRFVAEVYDELLAMTRDGVITPRVEVVAFEEVPDALDRLAERRTTGKLVALLES